ncbi:MAG: hypothetical protein AAF934_05015 [Bacteroidota bacterium]
MIRRTKLTLCFLGCFVLFLGNLYSQEVNANTVWPELKKNKVYGTVGSLGLSFIHYSISVERTLWNTNGLITNISARLGGGGWGGWTAGGTHFIGTIHALTGYRTFHFELNLGASYIRDTSDDDYAVFPAAALGFRLQKPGDYFLFRFGGGFPEGGYLSLGIAF